MKKYIFVLGFTLIFINNISGQNLKEREINKILVNNNLDSFIIYFFDENVDTETNVFLKFTKEQALIPIYWKYYDSLLYATRNYRFHELLFFNVMSVYKIAPDKLNVFIYDEFAGNANNKVRVHYSDSLKIIGLDTMWYFAKGQYHKADLTRYNLKKYTAVKMQATKISIYRQIIELAKAYYKPFVADNFNRNFIVENDADEDTLILRITNIRGLILPAESESWLVTVSKYFTFNWNEDWRKIEAVRLKIWLEKTSNNTFRLFVDAEGRYGSGVYKTTDWGKCLNMEPVYQRAVKDHAILMTNHFKEKLK